MRIAFYAPLKSPNHPTPSGDRLMARLLIKALERAGHIVDLTSELRSRTAVPEAIVPLRRQAAGEVERLAGEWRQDGPPDLFLCYHNYYKAPDLIGPAMADRFGLTYVTAEASLSPRRAVGPWAEGEAIARSGLAKSALSICFTRRDRDGLLGAMPGIPTAMLPPFLDTAGFDEKPRDNAEMRLVAVAMMRGGDKFESYRMLADALAKCRDLEWRLTIVGDGPLRSRVEALFAPLAARIDWLGQRDPAEIPAILASASIYVWPGFGEAYGLAYLEAQASGLPVVAQAVAGVPEVVRDGETGLLSAPGDIDAYVSALRRLIGDNGLRRDMAIRARRFLHRERSLAMAATTLKLLLSRFER